MQTLVSAMMACTFVSSLTACSANREGGGQSVTDQERIVTTDFVATPDGQKTRLYTLTNRGGLVAKVSDYGATLVEMHVPDKRGEKADVVLGFDSVVGYTGKDNPYFGATVGRVANRIAKGKFTLDGKPYTLAVNNGPNHLHGGPERGFSKVVWRAEPLATSDGQAVKFTYVSKDGEEGYPGNLTATTIYTLTDDDELRVEMTATTDAPTILNICNHTYWNLGGHSSGDVLDHRLTLHADRYTPTDDSLIPTGELKPVKGTPFDFTKAKPIGQDIAAFKSDKQTEITGGGYDVNYAVNGSGMRKVAEVADPGSGRTMTLSATEPGVQLYTGNWIKGVKGKAGAVYQQHQGFCLETQKYPDAINQPTFPSIVLRPGETYRHVMVHKFAAE